MTLRSSRTLLLASVVVLLAVGLAWAFWPERADRADLRSVSPITTSTTSTTTAPPAPATAAPPPPTTAPLTTPVVPSRLRIGGLGVDAAVVPVGLAPDGQMEIPPAADVGWYELGPQPGATGSAVLAAHVDYDGSRGAFFDLARLPVGAEVLVDGDGGTRRFVVTAREQIAKADIQLERYFTADGPTRITLITCGGAFDRGVGHYQDNLVITAEPVP